MRLDHERLQLSSERVAISFHVILPGLPEPKCRVVVLYQSSTKDPHFPFELKMINIIFMNNKLQLVVLRFENINNKKKKNETNHVWVLVVVAYWAVHPVLRLNSASVAVEEVVQLVQYQSDRSGLRHHIRKTNLPN